MSELPQKLGVESLLGGAGPLLLSQGLPSALTELERVAKSGRAKGVASVPMAQRLLWLAKGVQVQHPQRALEVCGHILQAQDTPPMEALLIAAVVQDRLGDRKASEVSARSVVEAERATPAEKLGAANLLVRFGQQELALRVAKDAFEAMGRPLSQAATLLYIAQVTADWGLVDQLSAQLQDGYAQGEVATINESPRTHLLWCDDEATNIEVLKHWSARNLPQGKAERPPVEPMPDRKIRVGYLSSDFREHPTARLVNGLLRHHDRSQFELFMYCSGWDDGSPIRREVESHFDQVHSVAKLGDAEAAQLIRSHRVDVLVELNGPTRANRMGVLAHRPAPVQIDYLGWPGSVGGRGVDYVVGDAVTVPPGAEAAYPEQVIRLNQVYQVNDYAARTLPPKPTRAQAGLPEGDHLVLGMFNAINKVHNGVWDVWMQILQAVPNALLWMLDPGPHARKLIAKAALARGVPVQRILAAPRLKEELHLARLQHCDLMLDPWPYGGHTSTADALFAGVPVVALEGKNFASRVSGALLRAAGMGALVQQDRVSYARFAVGLLKNPAELARVKAFVREQVPKTDVFNAKGKARQLEAAYRAALERVIEKKPFASINTRLPNAGGNVLQRQQDATEVPQQSRQIDWGSYRVAVVTPYFRIEPEKLQRCCASVASQTFQCDHILVADGEPQALPEGFKLIHMVLPANIGNSGATPRGMAAQYAFVQGYDAVAFLDSDNWFDPDHIELAVKALEQDLRDVVFSGRHVIFPDGEILQANDPQDADGKHVDTSCYVFSKRAAYLMVVMAMYPKQFGAIEDRIIRAVISRKNLKTRYLAKKTMWYETNWPIHYALANKKPVAKLHALKNRPDNDAIAEFLRTRCGFVF